MPELAPGDRKAEDLLDESEKLAESFQDKNHEYAFYLGELCRISQQIHSPKTLDRCVKAFREAAKLQSECDRDHLQTKAVAQISFVNPALAMDMLDKIQPPTYCTEAERAYWLPNGEHSER